MLGPVLVTVIVNVTFWPVSGVVSSAVFVTDTSNEVTVSLTESESLLESSSS